MIVHRRWAWIARAIASAFARAAAICAVLLSPPRRVGSPPRTLVTVGAPVVYGTGLASSRWLADSRRLRARPIPRPALPPASVEHLRQIFRDPRWATAFDASRAPRSPRAPQLADPHPSAQAGSSASSRPMSAPGPTTNADASAEHVQRRLTYVRELVRRGVYNEGFDPGKLPEQYRPRPALPGDPPLEPPRT